MARISREHCGTVDCHTQQHSIGQKQSDRFGLRLCSSGLKKPGSPAPAINTPAIPNRVRKAASGCRVRAVADGLVEKSFMRSAHLAGKGGSLNSLAPCGQLGRIYMRLSPEDGHPSYFPARQQQRSIDNPRVPRAVLSHAARCVHNQRLACSRGLSVGRASSGQAAPRTNALSSGRKGYPGVAL